jgi:hypothetical protein
MPTEESANRRPSLLLRLLVPFFGSDLFEILITLWRLGKRIIASQAREGMYEVQEHEAQLDLKDVEGKVAVYTKRQRVRFLQDNIIAYQDQAWGDGNIFADYKCSPGVAVDRYRDGYRWRILISLRQTKNYGDIEEFHIERTITDGFVGEVQQFQAQADHRTRKLSLSVVFPAKRLPKEVLLVEQNATRTTALGPEWRSILPDGREQVTWRTDKPRLFESYILRWTW